MFRRFWVWLFCLTEKEKDSIANLVLAKIDERQYKLDQLGPDKAELIGYTNHPTLPGCILAQYARENGSSSHCIEIPPNLDAHQVLEFLKTHPAANKS